MWSVLLACQEPFEVDRHDLVGFRIAAISAPPASPGQALEPSVALIVDGRPWSEEFVDLGWFWVDHPDDLLSLDPLSPTDATGPLPLLTVPEDARTLALVARLGEQEQRAFLSVAEGPPSFSGPSAIELSALPLALQALEGPELLLPARQELEEEPLDATSPGDFLRLRAQVEGDPLVRWMATAGTFFELDRHTADWAAGDLRLDDDEVEEGRAALEPGWVTFLALALGAPGETSFRAADVPVGIEPVGLWVGGRFVPTDAPVSWQPGDAVRGTLAADDTSPFGLRLEGASVEPADAVTDFGTSALSCLVSRDGPLDPQWWLTGVCARDSAVGVEVVIVPESP
jgi:hypothetical protein